MFAAPRVAQQALSAGGEPAQQVLHVLVDLVDDPANGVEVLALGVVEGPVLVDPFLHVLPQGFAADRLCAVETSEGKIDKDRPE